MLATTGKRRLPDPPRAEWKSAQIVLLDAASVAALLGARFAWGMELAR